MLLTVLQSVHSFGPSGARNDGEGRGQGVGGVEEVEASRFEGGEVEVDREEHVEEDVIEDEAAGRFSLSLSIYV